MTAAPHTAEALKCCPFCGARPHLNLGKLRRDSDGEAYQDTIIKCPHLCVTMTGPAALVTDRWNTRAIPAPDGRDAEIARLRDALADLAKQSRKTWNLGAQCGPHWTHLGVALHKAERTLTALSPT